MNQESKSNESSETYYGKAFTWDPNDSEEQSQLNSFLKNLADSEELQDCVSKVNSRAELIELGKSLGFNFSEATLESRTETLQILSEDEITKYSWGRWGEDGSKRWALLKWKKL